MHSTTHTHKAERAPECKTSARERRQYQWWRRRVLAECRRRVLRRALLTACRERPYGRSSFLAPGVEGLTFSCLNATLANILFLCVPPVVPYPFGMLLEGEC